MLPISQYITFIILLPNEFKLLPHRIYYTPSVTKKKAFVLLLNAPSSRKGQSTLDTSPEQKPLSFYDSKVGQFENTKFSQSLFHRLLNECETPTTPIYPY